MESFANSKKEFFERCRRIKISLNNIFFKLIISYFRYFIILTVDQELNSKEGLVREIINIEKLEFRYILIIKNIIIKKKHLLERREK